MRFLLFPTFFKAFHSSHSGSEGIWLWTTGDGDEISSEEVEAMHSAMWEVAVAFDWQAGDVLCIENERVMHGRVSFTGARRLACGFAAL